MIACELPADQLETVLTEKGGSPDKELAVGMAVDPRSGVAFLAMASGHTAVVALSAFRPSGWAAPDFASPELDDYGHTIRFGEYEASTDFALGQAATVLKPASEWCEGACCDRAGEHNGFGSDGPLLFVCPRHCPCHD